MLLRAVYTPAGQILSGAISEADRADRGKTIYILHTVTNHV